MHEHNQVAFSSSMNISSMALHEKVYMHAFDFDMENLANKHEDTDKEQNSVTGHPLNESSFNLPPQPHSLKNNNMKCLCSQYVTETGMIRYVCRKPLKK